MATAEQTKQQQQPTLQPEEYSEADYDTDDYEYSDDDEFAPQTQKVSQKTQPRKQQQQQRRTQKDDYVDDDDDDYTSDELYSDEYSDDDDYDDANGTQDNAVQPYQSGRPSITNNHISGGNIDTAEGKGKSIDDEEGMKLKLDLNLEIEVELKAQIHGDITLALL